MAPTTNTEHIKKTMVNSLGIHTSEDLRNQSIYKQVIRTAKEGSITYWFHSTRSYDQWYTNQMISDSSLLPQWSVSAVFRWSVSSRSINKQQGALIFKKVVVAGWGLPEREADRAWVYPNRRDSVEIPWHCQLDLRRSAQVGGTIPVELQDVCCRLSKRGVAHDEQQNCCYQSTGHKLRDSLQPTGCFKGKHHFFWRKQWTHWYFD